MKKLTLLPTLLKFTLPNSISEILKRLKKSTLVFRISAEKTFIVLN